MTRRWCAATLLALGLAAPARAQDVDGYLAMAREYAAGDGDKATESLQGWSEQAIMAAAGVAVTTASVHDLLAVAVLHTDVANNIIDRQPQSARFHLSAARAALDAASSRINQRQRLLPFVRRWYRFVASVYTSAELFGAAIDQIQRGMIAVGDDATLLVARGVVTEVATRKSTIADWRHDAVYTGSPRVALASGLRPAVQQFRLALALDPHSAEAHLHLGWIESLLGEPDAKRHLANAVEEAQDDRLRYLAHLFLGGLAERQRQLEDAEREYENAKAAGPDYQTAYTALSRVEQALGHDSRARELALLALNVDKRDADDPWWDHRIGFDRESLTWLRREVRQPQ